MSSRARASARDASESSLEAHPWKPIAPGTVGRHSPALYIGFRQGPRNRCVFNLFMADKGDTGQRENPRLTPARPRRPEKLE